jgi:hypothetical protein
MRKLYLAAALAAVLAAGCGDDTPSLPDALPSPSPAAAPSPSPSPTVAAVQTFIVAILRGETVGAWASGQIPSLEARQVCLSSPSAAAKAGTMTYERARAMDEVVPCPPEMTFGSWAWVATGAGCVVAGSNIYGPSVYVQCFSFGWVDVTVTPPQGPQGRGLFRVQP